MAFSAKGLVAAPVMAAETHIRIRMEKTAGFGNMVPEIFGMRIQSVFPVAIQAIGIFLFRSCFVACGAGNGVNSCFFSVELFGCGVEPSGRVDPAGVTELFAEVSMAFAAPIHLVATETRIGFPACGDTVS